MPAALSSTRKLRWIAPGKGCRPRWWGVLYAVADAARSLSLPLCAIQGVHQNGSAWPAAARADTRCMGDQQVWRFERAAERLIVRRRVEPDAFELEIESNDGVPRVHRFEEEDKFLDFQNDLQYMLVHSGWTLLEFEPDRRTGRDRRGFPRVKNDRRRWWTDGAEPVKSESRRKTKPSRTR